MRILVWLALCLLPSLALAQTGNLYPSSVHATGVIKGLSPVGTQSGTSCTLGQTSGGCAGLADGDCGAYISFTSASAITVTAANSLPVGCQISLNQNGAGKITVTPGSGATMNTSSGNLSTSAQYVQVVLTVAANSGGAAAIYNVLSSGASTVAQTTTFTSDPQVSAMNNIYGVPFITASLWNQRVGSDGACGTSGSESLANFQHYHAVRVRFPKSGTITSVSQYFTNGAGGYGAGTGGSYNMTAVADNGSGSPNLSNVVGGPSNTQAGITVAANTTQNRIFTFSPGVAVVAGTDYHFVLQNQDGSPGANCTSTDDLGMYITGGVGIGRSPAGSLPATQLVVEGSYDGTNWTSFVTNKPSLVPTIDFFFADGTDFGSGYYEVSATGAGGGTGHTVDSTNQVRQTFTVSGSTMSVTTLKAAARLVSGSGLMTATLKTGSTTVATGAGSAITIGADSWGPSNQQWITWTFSPAITLTSGTAYTLTFSVAAGTTYVMHGQRENTGFTTPGSSCGPTTSIPCDGNGSKFHDGNAQYSSNTGSTWTNWDTWGTPDQEMDLSFFFQ